MNGRERFLTAINNEKPDRLPCQVHSWMDYYLQHYLNGMDQYQAYDYLGMDPVIYTSPGYTFDPGDLTRWQEAYEPTGTDGTGNHHWKKTVTTPGGVLTEKGALNEFTAWITEPLIKNEEDFELWGRYVPLPVSVNWDPVIEAKNKIADHGIVRGSYFDFGQGSPWQSFLTLYDTQQAIIDCFDKPDWIHHVLSAMLKKKLQVIETGGTIHFDLLETGGGAGSSTVISPKLHREFCLPYDQIQHQALHRAGAKIVYHLCGGLMPLLELVAENGADGLETMTPPEMGGDCDLAEATRRVGNKLFFIGGFDQNRGIEKGDPETIRRMVHQLHEACPDGGYICSPSDHFFFGDPGNIRAFAAAAHECRY